MEFTAERIVPGGDAFARTDAGRVVLIEGALPGERVRVEVTTDRSELLMTRAVEILEPSPDRVEPPCPYARAGCGGCSWQHVRYDAQPGLKHELLLDALRRIAHIDAPPLRDTITLPDLAYRTTVRALVVDGHAAFRKHHSHDPITFDTCMVAHPLVDDVLQKGDFGAATEVTVRASVATGERSVLADPTAITVDVPDDVVQGVSAHIHEEIDGRRFRVSTRSFFQSRTDGAAALAHHVREAVGPKKVIADLYCGVGILGALCETPERILAVESSRSSVADAKVNLRGFNAHVVHADVAKLRPVPVDVVIADPSRAGLGKQVVKKIRDCEPQRVVLVSCDAAAMARDIALLDAAGFDLKSVTPVDMFPHTPHVECVSVLDTIH